MTSKNEFVEIQGTAEGKPFVRDTVNGLLDLSEKGIQRLFEIQQSVIETLKPTRSRRARA
jgi:ribonuclease PH